MTAHAALAPLKSAAIRHGVNVVVADVYDVAAAYDCSLADAQKIALRQSRQNVVYRYEQCKLHAVRALNDCFAIFAVNVQDIFRTKAVLLKPCVQVGHRDAPFPIDIASIAYLERKHN